jgi:hypothetical protein
MNETCALASEEEITLSKRMGLIDDVAKEIKSKAAALNNQLYGVTDKSEDADNPVCFKEDLDKLHFTLARINELLECMLKKL